MKGVPGVAEYIQTNWAVTGVEVAATGAETLTLRLPPNLPELSELCVELYELFQATVSIKHVTDPFGAQLTIRVPSKAMLHSASHAIPNPNVASAATNLGWGWGWYMKCGVVAGLGIITTNLEIWDKFATMYNRTTM